MRPTQRQIAESNELYAVLGGKLDLDDCRYLGKQPARRRQTEAGEQTALFQWVKLAEKQYPALRLLFHIPNGGRRDAIEGAHLKSQGVRAGVPDLCLPVPSGSYHGLFIEMKAPAGRVQHTQKAWLDALNARGYKAAVCYGFEQAKECIIGYLSDENKL